MCRLRDARWRPNHLLGLPNSTFEVRTRLHQIQAESVFWAGNSEHALDISRLALCDIADADERGSAGNVLNLAMRACADLHQVGITRRADTIVSATTKAAREIQPMAGTLNPAEIVMYSVSVVADAEVTEWQNRARAFQMRTPGSPDGPEPMRGGSGARRR